LPLPINKTAIRERSIDIAIRFNKTPERYQKTSKRAADVTILSRLSNLRQVAIPLKNLATEKSNKLSPFPRLSLSADGASPPIEFNRLLAGLPIPIRRRFGRASSIKWKLRQHVISSKFISSP
jgi:hypothetical protein